MTVCLDHSIRVELENVYDYFHELRSQSSGGVPLSHDRVTPDLGELVEEAYKSSILSDMLPLEADRLRVEIIPSWSSEPFVKRITVAITTCHQGKDWRCEQHFTAGRWSRTAQLSLQQLREEGTLAQDQLAYPVLSAQKSAAAANVTLPPLQPPPIVDQSLEHFGIRRLGEGNLVPDRPVLVNSHFHSEAIRLCEEADALETGGAVLGKIIRLAAPLPGTQTRIVTILSAVLEDNRHVGTTSRFTFSPEALAEAAQVCQLRGLGESVLTVFHTHGWSNRCGNCNQNEQCPLAESVPSLLDYDLAANLFASKSTLLPIAGRKFGAEGRRPVLQVHAWRGGVLRPIRYQLYDD